MFFYMKENKIRKAKIEIWYFFGTATFALDYHSKDGWAWWMYEWECIIELDNLWFKGIKVSDYWACKNRNLERQQRK